MHLMSKWPLTNYVRVLPRRVQHSFRTSDLTWTKPNIKDKGK